MSVMRAVVVLSLLVVFAQAQNRPKKTLREGDRCRLANHQKGTCRLFAECQSALDDVAKRDKWPLTCSYDPDDNQIVCCDEHVQAQPSTTTKAPRRKTTTTTTTTTTSRPISFTTHRIAPHKGGISHEKCKKYALWQQLPSLLPDEATKWVKGQCGAHVETFILNGQVAGKLEFPHMAHLGYTHDPETEVPEWSCGGSLISERYVLTAAHCIRRPDSKNVSHVRLGAATTRTTVILRVEHVEMHHQYKKTVNYFDIALLRLEADVAFNNYLRPACLHRDREIGNAAIASGWGATETNRSSDRLLKTRLPFVPYSECSQTYSNNPLRLPRGIDDKTMICAGGLKILNDTCQGDSGGPLQIVLKDPDCMYSIIGITSFGIACGVAPGVYTRVSAYVSWIENIVWPPQPEKNIILFNVDH